MPGRRAVRRRRKGPDGYRCPGLLPKLQWKPRRRAMSRPDHVFPDGADAEKAADHLLRDAARKLVDAVEAEPVPDHLRQLALALGQALDAAVAKRRDQTPD